jgi:hypothetical protein
MFQEVGITDWLKRPKSKQKERKEQWTQQIGNEYLWNSFMLLLVPSPILMNNKQKNIETCRKKF